MLLRCWWGGVGGGGDVNVPCTSYMIYCYAAEISGTTLHVATLLMGWGGGWGMLTYLVLLAWSIATLLRSLGSFTMTIYRRNEKISCHTGTIDAAWSAVKNFIPNSLSSKSKDLLLYVKCWQWRYVNGHSRLQQKTISTLKRLVWQRMKKGLAHFAKNPHETQIWPNLRAQIWPNFAYQTVCFAVAKPIFFWKRAFYCIMCFMCMVV